LAIDRTRGNLSLLVIRIIHMDAHWQRLVPGVTGDKGLLMNRAEASFAKRNGRQA
jgi:hypothetical protein